MTEKFVRYSPDVEQEELEGTRTNEFQQLIQAAMTRGFQTRDAEMDLAQLLGDLKPKRIG